MSMEPQFAALIVHDLKNALGVLESELWNLTLEPNREQALNAHAHCVTLRDKLIGFLTLYKDSSQGLQARIEDCNPEDFLEGLLRQRLDTRADLKLSIDTQDMPAVGFFDEHLVGLALDAALQNALRFARSSIVLGCTEQDGALVFSISDDGGGLGTKEDRPSTGLGMALCSAIAHAHRKDGVAGSVSLRDRPEGGAVFELRLP